MKTNQREVDPASLNSLALAFMGDAILEAYVREAMIASGTAKINTLHKMTVDYVSAKAQVSFLYQLLDEEFLSEAEQAIVRRGRNAKAHGAPKHTDVQTYNYSTGFEALIGYLYFSGLNERIDEIIDKMFASHPIERGAAQ
ncbi:MAG: ribonuclease III domain-containing protein [Sporolactobacillus sp.]